MEKVVFKDQIPPEGGRKYSITANADGSSNIQDITQYVQDGTALTANFLNDLQDAIPTVYTITVPASGWSTVVPYINMVAVPGITADTVLSDLQLAPAQVGNAAAEKAMAQWSMLDTQAGYVQFIAPTARPTADFTILAREVK